ncbi:hypothetical protein [Hydrogenophaga sp. OTU3427]|uniref:hypothetical protein n=1 Tax=Hydrogenophaga sp. OTU3427 TaxID=3043856 RepID=UPI00313AE37C
MKALKFLLSAAIIAANPAFAQNEKDDGCKLVGNLLGALFGQGLNPCGPSNGGAMAQNTSPRPNKPPSGKTEAQILSENTERYLDQLVATAREYYDVEPGPNVERFTGRASAGAWHIPLQCTTKAIEERWPELDSFRMSRERTLDILPNSYTLSQLCVDRTNIFMETYVSKHKAYLANLVRERNQAKQAEEAREAKEKEDARILEENQRLADLRSGRKTPDTCREHMISKGISNSEFEQFSSRNVMFPALEPPKGYGLFLGTVANIEGRSLYLRGELDGRARNELPSNSYVVLNDSTRIFKGDQIRIGAKVAGVATQQKTQSAKLTNGASVTVAIMQAACITPF